MSAPLPRRAALLSAAIFASLFSPRELHSQTFSDLRDIGLSNIKGLASTSQGAAVFGSATIGGNAGIARWTPMGGLVEVISSPDFELEDVSVNGSVLVGRAPGSGENRFRPSAYRVTVGGATQELATNIRDVSFRVQSRVSADGSTVVGFGSIAAFRWTEQTGTTLIGAKLDGSDVVGPENQFFFARDLSSNGSVVVGMNTLSPLEPGEAARWTELTGPLELGTGGYSNSTATGVSGDGSIVVGTAFWGTDDFSAAFRWTKETGMVTLGDLEGASSTFATGISADGSIIVGGIGSYYNQFNDSEPFVWTVGSGLQRLVDLLTDQYGLGNEIAGWQFRTIADLSADGRFLLGNGIGPDGREGTWLVDLGMTPIPEPSTYGLIGAVGLLALIAIRRRSVRLLGKEGRYGSGSSRGEGQY